MYQRIRRMARVWAKGRHSNLPRCCVAYFVLVRLHVPTSLLCRWRDFKDNRYPLAYRPRSRQYVRCPVCFLRNRWGVQHLCDETCIGKRGACIVRYDQ
jgi:hypothetical protein